jgi:transposase
MAYPPAMDTHPTLPQELWERTPPEVQASIEVLEARQASMGALETRVVALEALVQALQAQRNQTAPHASRPPSSDPPQPPPPRRARGKRRRGGQPGHPGHTRTLLPGEAVDAVVVRKPEECTPCHAPVSGDEPKLWRHQVIEIPPITPVVTEYPWQQLVCAACGAVTRASWPVGVPSGPDGPRVPATVARYPGAYRFSKRPTQQLMDDVCGVPWRVGTISLLAQATTAAVAAPVEEARTSVPTQEVAHRDATRWHQGDKQAW